MLYELAATVCDPDTGDEHYVHTVVEAPAHRKGKIPEGLRRWVNETWLTQWSGPVTWWKVSVYIPHRIGYRDANSFGVSELGRTVPLVEWDA